MDTKAVTDFLQKIIDQLGPMGDKAFHIVAGRVIAESVVGFATGLVLLFIGSSTALYLWKLANKHVKDGKYDDTKEMLQVISASVMAFTLVPVFFLLTSNAVNLFSIDYTTIERIVNLVNGVKP